jgi:protein N-terminal asparagine amidohydrolase
VDTGFALTPRPNHTYSDGDMLLVDGEPVTSSSAPSGSSPTGSSGRELVAALMGNPGLCAASERLRAAPERQISSGPEGPRHVYVFQREYATVDPARVELVGTDEMTTCVGVAVRNNKTGM